MSNSVLPPIRDILPGYLHEYQTVSPSTTPSPPLSSRRPYSSATHYPSQHATQRRSPSESENSPQSATRSPRSISSYIPTPSFQFKAALKGRSQPDIVDTRGSKRPRTPSSDGSLRSEKDHQSESDDEASDHPAPSKKRRREEKKHACPYCNKLFHRPVSLGVHINTHTGDKPYTCPFPNCSRQFNVNSNMRRHYRTHFTPGTVDLSELSYSAADEKFYRHAATNPASSNVSRAARFGPTSHYLPPTPSAAYNSRPHYSRENPPPDHGNSYAIVPVSYIPVVYNHRPSPPSLDPSRFSSRHHEYEREVDRSVGRLKPASDWNLGRVQDRDAHDRGENSHGESESDYEEDHDADEVAHIDR